MYYACCLILQVLFNFEFSAAGLIPLVTDLVPGIICKMCFRQDEQGIFSFFDKFLTCIFDDFSKIPSTFVALHFENSSNMKKTLKPIYLRQIPKPETRFPIRH